jgi:hypothetical protein
VQPRSGTDAGERPMISQPGVLVPRELVSSSVIVLADQRIVRRRDAGSPFVPAQPEPQSVHAARLGLPKNTYAAPSVHATTGVGPRDADELPLRSIETGRSEKHEGSVVRTEITKKWMDNYADYGAARDLQLRLALRPQLPTVASDDHRICRSAGRCSAAIGLDNRLNAAKRAMRLADQFSGRDSFSSCLGRWIGCGRCVAEAKTWRAANEFRGSKQFMAGPEHDARAVRTLRPRIGRWRPVGR